MQSYLAQHPPPVRPRTKVELTKAAFEKTNKRLILSPDVQDLITLMRGAKDSGKNRSTKTVGNWFLDYRGHYTWRTSSKWSQDFPKWAALAKLEVEAVATYRKTMLEDCPAAAWLRQEIQQLFDSSSAPKQVVAARSQKTIGRNQVVREYRFPDRISVGEIVSLPEIDVITLSQARFNNSRGDKQRVGLGTWLTKGESMEMCAATPMSKMLSPRLDMLFGEIEKVYNAMIRVNYSRY
jgi:hypothetical protein